MVDATKHFLLKTEEKKVHGGRGKRTTRLQFRLAAVIHCQTAKFFVLIVIREPEATEADGGMNCKREVSSLPFAFNKSGMEVCYVQQRNAL